jgi:hypothetical protein
VHERPVSYVPRWVLGLLAAALATQMFLAARRPAPQASLAELGAPPSADLVRLASLGEPVAAAKLMMLYLQAFDYRAGSRVRFRDLDYSRLVAWLDTIIALDPEGQYPLLTASHIYAGVPEPDKARAMLDLVARRYREAPNRRWPWMAHAAYVAKHQLKDLPLARRYAAELQKLTTTPDAPLWVKQMEFFILEDMNELEAARVMLGGLIASGQIQDRRELELMEERLKGLEARIEREREEAGGGASAPEPGRRKDDTSVPKLTVP